MNTQRLNYYVISVDDIMIENGLVPYYSDETENANSEIYNRRQMLISRERNVAQDYKLSNVLGKDLVSYFNECLARDGQTKNTDINYEISDKFDVNVYEVLKQSRDYVALIAYKNIMTELQFVQSERGIVSNNDFNFENTPNVLAILDKRKAELEIKIDEFGRLIAQLASSKYPTKKEKRDYRPIFYAV